MLGYFIMKLITHFIVILALASGYECATTKKPTTAAPTPVYCGKAKAKCNCGKKH